MSSSFRFHSVHGTGVHLVEDNTGVERLQDSFGRAIVFSRSPVPVNVWLSFELRQTDQWSGALRVGVTLLNPDCRRATDFPVHAFPKLNDQKTHWIRPLPECMVGDGCRLTVHISAAGALHCFIDGVHRGALLIDLPIMVPLWLLLDVYGNTIGVTAVPTTETPSEVVARGPDALAAYQRACHSGSVPCYRTRLMLVGQDKAGKTSLKKSLLGLGNSSQEDTKDSIDLSSSCSFLLSTDQENASGTLWRQVSRHQFSNMVVPSLSGFWNAAQSDIPQSSAAAERLNEDSLEDQYNYALAENIVQEMLSQERCSSITSSNSSTPAGDTPLSRQPRIVTRPKISPLSPAEGNAASRLLQEMPEKIVELVTDILSRRRSSAHTTSSPSSLRQPHVSMDVWDFAGQEVYYTTHQVFLTYRAVYLIVFDVTKDLDEPSNLSPLQNSTVMSRLDCIDYWMHLIHVHAAQNLSDRCSTEDLRQPQLSDEHCPQPLAPPIILVGTHKNSLGEPGCFKDDVEGRCAAQFNKILERTRYKPYGRQVVQKCFAVENGQGQTLDNIAELQALRNCIEETVRSQSYMGEMIPLKWLRLERRLVELVVQETRLVTLNQLSAVAQEEGLYSSEELLPALSFLHDLGSVVFYGSSSFCESALRDTLILDPRWLVQVFGAVINARPLEQESPLSLSEAHLRLVQHAVLEERLLDHYWRKFSHQKPALVSLMERFDLIAKRLPNPSYNSAFSSLERTFFVPSLLNPWSSQDGKVCDSPNAAIFYFKYAEFLPGGFFQRLLCRAVRWSQEQGGRDPVLFRNRAWFFVDQEHDFGLELESPHHLARIKVSIYRVSVSDDGSQVPGPPSQFVVAKVRNFLESALSELRALWMRRASYNVMVACPCARVCIEHNVESCSQPGCIHCLSLDECLASRVVVCGHRRLKTDMWKRWFPDPCCAGDTGTRTGSVPACRPGVPAAVIPNHVLAPDVWNIEVQKGKFLPQWMKSTAKLLNGGEEGRDWLALAEKMGYNEARIARFNEDLNPALILLSDWVISNGNTALAVDMIVACLLDISRKDIADVIDQERESDEERVAIFLSYQWDSQEEVRALRDRLERRGYSCWMDIGQMGGGDLLNARIDRALRACSAVIACVTPRYVISPLCSRELSLADLLRKPLIPVMLERTPWPPPGPLALVLSQYVYVDMRGVGGHGGAGRHADMEDRYSEILAQVSKYVEPVLVPMETSPTPPSLHTSITRPATVLHHHQQNPPFHLFEVAQAVDSVETAAPPRADSSSERSINVLSDSPRQRLGQPFANINRREQSPLRGVHVRRCTVCSIL